MGKGKRNDKFRIILTLQLSYFRFRNFRGNKSYVDSQQPQILNEKINAEALRKTKTKRYGKDGLFQLSPH